MKSTYETISEQLTALYVMYWGAKPSDSSTDSETHAKENREAGSRYNFCHQWTLEENGWTQEEYLAEFYRDFRGC